MKKILVITYYWPPSGGAGVQRWLKFTRYLPDFGFEPFVLTVNPEYASYPQKDESLLNDVSSICKVFHTKTFELYNLYKIFSGNREIPYGGFANEKKPGLLQKLMRVFRSHFLIPDPRKGWNNYAYRKACELIKEFSIDTIVTTSPPHSTQLIGLKLKKKFNIRWIADMRDPWTDIFYYKSLYHSKLSAYFDKSLERKVLENADRIITVSQALKEIFSKKIGELASPKIHVIPNGFDTRDFTQKVIPHNTDFTITYTGTLSGEYRIDGFLEVISDLISEGYKFKLKFIGKFPQSLLQKINELGLTDICEFQNYMPHDKAIQNMLLSDALLLVIPDVKDNKGILTGKLFEYIGSERPIIGLGPADCDAALILEKTQCGSIIHYDDRPAIRKTLMSYYEAYKNSEPAIFPQNIINYSRYELTRRLGEIIK